MSNRLSYVLKCFLQINTTALDHHLRIMWIVSKRNSFSDGKHMLWHQWHVSAWHFRPCEGASVKNYKRPEEVRSLVFYHCHETKLNRLCLLWPGLAPNNCPCEASKDYQPWVTGHWYHMYCWPHLALTLVPNLNITSLSPKIYFAFSSTSLRSGKCDLPMTQGHFFYSPPPSTHMDVMVAGVRGWVWWGASRAVKPRGQALDVML